MGKNINWRRYVAPLLLLVAAAAIYWYGWGGAKDVEIEPGEVPEAIKVAPGQVKITYLGHSAFLVESSDWKILMDPYSPEIGYGELSLEVDVITVSHEHLDHNYIEAGQGNPKVLRGLSPGTLQWEDIDYEVNGLKIYNIGTYHDDEEGRYRGRSSIFVLEMEEIRLAHLGDLGHLLEEEQIEKLAPVDILIIPVGGHYTIGPSEALQVIEGLDPRAVIPMHYRTERTEAWPIKEINNFLAGQSGMKHAGQKAVLVTKDKLPEVREIWPLAP